MKSTLYLVLPLVLLVFIALGLIANTSLEPGGYVGDSFLAIGGVLAIAWLVLFHSKVANFFRLKGTRNRFVSATAVLLVGGIAVGAGMISSRSRFNLSWDLTRDQINTLSEQSLKLIDKFKSSSERKLEILGFFQSDEERDKFKSLLATYQGQGLNARVEYIDTDESPTKAIAHNITLANTVVFKVDGHEARITSFSEEKITNALIKLLKPKSKKIYFVAGHGEYSIDSEEPEGMSLVAQDLKNNSYSIASLSMIDQLDVPSDADLLVVAGPKYDFSEVETKLLGGYLEKGGALIAMVGAIKDLPNLKAFLKEYGLILRDDLILLNPEDPRSQLLGQDSAIISEFDEFNQVTKDFASDSGVALIFSRTRSLVVDEDNKHKMKASLIAHTSESMMRVKGVKSEQDLAHIDQSHLEQGSFGVVAYATGMLGGEEYADADIDEKTQSDAQSQKDANRKVQVMVAGSSMFATNAGVQKAANFDMFMNMVNLQLKDEDLISIRPREKTSTNLDMAAVSSHFSLLFISFVYPFFFLGMGVFIWLRRRTA